MEQTHLLWGAMLMPQVMKLLHLDLMQEVLQIMLRGFGLNARAFGVGAHSNRKTIQANSYGEVQLGQYSSVVHRVAQILGLLQIDYLL